MYVVSTLFLLFYIDDWLYIDIKLGTDSYLSTEQKMWSENLKT